MIEFNILTPEAHCLTLKEQLDSLYTQMPQHLLQVRIYLSDAANQWDEVAQHPLFSQSICKAAWSCVEQPPIGMKIALQVLFTDSLEGFEISHPADFVTVIRKEKMLYVFHTVRYSNEEAARMDDRRQTIEAFERHKALLSQYDMNVCDNCHRTWIFVRDIDRHYAGVVQGRNEFFAENGLTSDTHYIASTGIGGDSTERHPVVAIDFFSVKGLEKDAVKYLHATDYLNPTREYGVAFERGTQLNMPVGKTSLISGTASIDKFGKCIHIGDVLTQAGRLFLNIEKLLEDGNQQLSDMKYMIVYLRDIADTKSVEQYLDMRFPNVPKLITAARVCRPEWLIEVECIAIS